jgi:predicted aspartyl protease
MSSSRSTNLLVLLAGFAVFIVAPLGFAAETTDANLKSLYKARRWFELRDAIAKGGASTFYQGAAACAFNNLHRCEKKLGSVIKSRPQSDEAFRAHEILASAYLREGKYRNASAQVDALLALRPGDSDAQNTRPLLATLSRFPDQQISHRGSATVQLQENGLPISVNGVQVTYWFDTGANLSILSESEAKRIGLAVRPVSTKMGVSTGEKIGLEIAAADELAIGSVRLKHVAFLVASDEQPPFNESPPGSRGLIGMPVLLAFQRFVWGPDKTFEIGSKSLSRAPHGNLCFDGLYPVAQIQFENRNLAFVLDTGATNTDLYPPFATAFPQLISTAAKTDSYKMEGVGSIRYIDAATLPSFNFTLGGFPVVLKPANVLLKPTGEASKFFEGNLGIDLLQQAHKTTFDFKAMTLTLE